MFQRFERALAVPTSRRSRSPWLNYVKIFALILACVSVRARADLVFGVTSEGGITSGGSEFVGQNWSVGQGSVLPVTSYTSPILSASGSCASCGGTAAGSATAWSSSDGGSLHGYATASQSGICDNCVGGFVQVGGAFYTQWIDTIIVTGLPNGTPVELVLTDALHSTETFSAAGVVYGPGVAQLESVLVLGGQELDLLNNQGAANGFVTQSVIVDTVSGATLQLAATLTGSADAAGVASATVDASDTANSYITVLTPGASYTTASGVDYAPPSTAPEPKSFWVMATAFAGIWAGTRRRLRARG
jgi:hypothetical protein